MSTIKIEHVNPNSGRSIAFDVVALPRKDVKTTENPDGTVTYEDGTVVKMDGNGNEIRDTFVLRHGEFRLFNLSGGLMLHEVSMAELDAREKKSAEQAELEAEVARERKAKADQEHAEKVKVEREEHKKKIEAEAAKQDRAAADDTAAAKSHDATFGDNWKPEQSKPREPFDIPPGLNALGEPFHGKPEDAKTYAELGRPEPAPVVQAEPVA